MSGVALELRTSPPAAVDASSLLPERLRGLSPEQLARLPLPLGRHRVAVGDLFRIRPHAANQLRLVGDCRALLDVGARLEAGTLVVEGDVGPQAGREMRGGRLEIEGSAGDRLGCGMRGGELRVAGDAGDDAAGPLPGQRAGMRGGRLVIGGRAGRRLAYRMRRGTLVVRGPLGSAPAARMIAGTIAARGPFPPDTGIGMRRGTLLSATASAPPVGGRFTSPVICPLDFLRLLLRDLATDLPELQEQLGAEGAPPLRALGDITRGGQGEWIAPGESAPEGRL